MILTQEKINSVLKNIRNEKSYYVGGSLCVDNVLPNKDVLVMNLDETYFGFVGGKKNLLNIDNIKLLFGIYKEVKGENGYYKEQLQKSCIKHIN